MTSNLIVDAYHDASIIGLMYLRPATLFHRINTLPWYKGTLQTWSGSLRYRAGDSILEVGCASGQLTKHMSNRGAIAHGVDKSAKMLKMANISNTASAHFAQASALDLPFCNNRFDYILAASLINIISEPETALREMVRVCKPDGKVTVLVPLAGMMDEDVANLANELNLEGFSRAALTAWHRSAPKMQREKLLEYFARAGLHHTSHVTYLNGMVAAMTGTKRAAD